MKKTILTVLIAAAAIAGGSAAAQSAGKSGNVVQELQTQGGPLQVIRNAENDFSVVLGGRQLLRDTDDVHLGISAALPKGSAPRYVLLSFSDGSAACPAMYRVLEITGGSGKLSEIFGTCSDIPAMTASGSGVVVAMPRLDGKGNQTWTYRDGTLNAPRR